MFRRACASGLQEGSGMTSLLGCLERSLMIGPRLATELFRFVLPGLCFSPIPLLLLSCRAVLIWCVSESGVVCRSLCTNICYILPFNSKQSGRSPLPSFCSSAAYWIFFFFFFFFCTFLCTLKRLLCVKINVINNHAEITSFLFWCLMWTVSKPKNLSAQFYTTKVSVKVASKCTSHNISANRTFPYGWVQIV